MNYYQEVLEKINQLKNENPVLAYSYIQEELRMPYIDSEVLEKLLVLEKEVKANLPRNEKKIVLSEVLYSDQFLMGVEYLRNCNIRNELEEVEQFLCSEESNLKKGLIILILIDQGVYQEIKMKKDGLEIEFSPNQIEIPSENDVIIALFQKIEIDMMQYPSLKNACIDELSQKAIENLPFSYEESEGNVLLDEIYCRICSLYGENELYEKINTCKTM